MRIEWMAGLMMMAETCAGAEHSQLPRDVTVSVEELTRVDSLQVSRSEAKAHAMFAAIGVRVEWARGGPWRYSRHMKCDANSGVVIKVRLVGAEAGGNRGVMGYASPYATGEKIIVIRYDMVQAAETSLVKDALLAHVFVHEITHVLQCIAYHDEKGIMQKYWSPSQIAEMPRMPMSFTPDGVELIRMGLKKLVEDGCPVTADMAVAR
jgi:hypothetical protein